MAEQLTFAAMAWQSKGKTTKRERFLAEMNAVIPWTALSAIIEPHYPKAGNGTQPSHGRAGLTAAVNQGALTTGSPFPGTYSALFANAGETMAQTLERISCETGSALANLAEPLVKYRQHFESVANTKHEDQWQVKATIVGDAYDRRGMAKPAQWPFEKRVPLSPIEQLKRWAWAALKHGNARVARKHAAKIMAKRPFSIDSWRVMYCAVRGR